MSAVVPTCVLLAAPVSTCNSHSVGSSVENRPIHVYDTGRSLGIHALSYATGMMHACLSTVRCGTSNQAGRDLQRAAGRLSPASTAAKKTDEYFKSALRKGNCWWVVDGGDNRYGTLYSPPCNSHSFFGAGGKQ